MRSSPFIVLALLLGAPVTASTWTRDYDMGINASFGPIAGLPDGGCVLVADGQNGTGGWDTSIARMDGAGRVLWQRIRGTGEGDRIRDVEVAPDGSLLLTGFTYSRGGFVQSYLADGTLGWARQYFGENLSTLRWWTDGAALAGGGALLVGSGDGVVTTACDEFFEDECTDAVIARIDAQGRLVWARALHSGGEEEGVAIEARPDGGALVAVAPDLLVSISGSGDVEWAQRLEFVTPDCGVADRLRSLALLDDGSILLSGGGEACSVERGWVVRLDPSGSVAWERRDEWPLTDGTYWGWGAVAALPDGRIVLQGRAHLAVLGADGVVEWVRRFPLADSRWAFSGSMALVGDDILVDWQWTPGLSRVGRDGQFEGSACVGIEAAALPGGLTTPRATSAAVVTTRTLALMSRVVGLQELVTCADPRCIELCASVEADCQDGADDDLDGFTDCDDSDCADAAACDPDGDGDGVRDGLDCAPADPSVQEPPLPMILRVASDAATGGVVLSWEESGTARSDMVFDVATGDLDRSTDPTCLGRDLSARSLSREPAGDAAAWYLVRARNACGSTGFGGPTETGACD